MINKLIFSPHIDDEVLGCSSVLDKDTMVYYGGFNESHIGTLTQESHVKSRVSYQTRIDELKQLADITRHNYYLADNKINQYKSVDLISVFERCINKYKPEYVYIPHPSYNQDHRAFYEAALTALRPHDVNWFVKKILVYEQPSVTFWDQKNFKATYFRPLKPEYKIRLYKTLKSQVRSFRSPDQIRAILKLRGAESGHNNAEAFQILRWSE